MSVQRSVENGSAEHPPVTRVVVSLMVGAAGSLSFVVGLALVAGHGLTGAAAGAALAFAGAAAMVWAVGS